MALYFLRARECAAREARRGAGYAHRPDDAARGEDGHGNAADAYLGLHIVGGVAPAADLGEGAAELVRVGYRVLGRGGRGSASTSSM